MHHIVTKEWESKISVTRLGFECINEIWWKWLLHQILYLFLHLKNEEVNCIPGSLNAKRIRVTIKHFWFLLRLEHDGTNAPLLLCSIAEHRTVENLSEDENYCQTVGQSERHFCWHQDQSGWTREISSVLQEYFST